MSYRLLIWLLSISLAAGLLAALPVFMGVRL